MRRYLMITVEFGEIGKDRIKRANINSLNVHKATHRHRKTCGYQRG